ncbi:MAG: hypothetical protein ACTS8H_04675 [Arsenophonus sp. NC-PE1-MAG3]
MVNLSEHKYPCSDEEAGEKSRRTVGILWTFYQQIEQIRTTNLVELAFVIV